MYKIVSISKDINSGKTVIFYGIKSEKVCFPDLSSDKEAVENLCRQCNALKIDEAQIFYIIDDFINSKSGLAPELSGR